MKKVLAWAVALALVLSSFTMAFAADAGKTSKDFSDADQIQYTEAVDVMVATGIINGFPDGTFGPQKTVKRSEMAKMIACIMNGGEDVGDQYKSACPFKDSQKHWAAGYIAYCASEHIIDGRSADVFDPEATVTGTEVAKMALTSLGYDSKIQGYTGETWAANVLKDAKKNDLFKDLDKSFVPGDPCDRESAAQILFNMLKATEVEYSNNTSISVGGDTQVVVSSKAEPVKKDEQTVELYEDVFNGKLNLDPTKKTDDFERPAHAWTYPDTKTEVGTYPDSADYEFTAKATPIDKAIEAYDKDLAKEIKDAKITPDVKVNGTTGTLALGDKVELYYDKQKKTCKAVVTQYKPYQIKTVNTKIKDAEEGVTAKIKFDTLTKEYTNKEIAGYDNSSYVKDAIIAVAVGKDGKILDSYVPKELVAGKVSATEIKSSNVVKATIDGKEYEPSVAPLKLYGEDSSIEVGHEYTIYDYNGYMFAGELVKAPAPEEFYGMVTGTKDVKGEKGEWTGVETEATPKDAKWVLVLTPEGKSESYELALAENATYSPKAGDLVTYQLNEDGAISVVTKATAGASKDAQATSEWKQVSMKTGGVLNGKQVVDKVAAYAYIPKTATEAGKWIVYDFEKLEAAKALDVYQYIDTKSGLVAMEIASLEGKAEDKTVLAFYTGNTQIKNDTGTAYKIDVFENGAAKTYTTVGTTKNQADVTKVETYFGKFKAPFELVKLTFEGDLVKNIEAAKCIAQTAPTDNFKIGDVTYDALFFGTDGEVASASIYKVLGVSGNSLNVGTADNPETTTNEGFINNQTVDSEKAVVLYVNEKKELEESEFANIEADNYVILMKVDPKSSSWDTVIFTDTLPAGFVAVNEATPN